MPGVPRSLAERVRTFPDAPGVYLFKNAEGKILYVGKAVSLRRRASSYLGAGAARDPKTRLLMRSAADAECILAGDEREAFLLEDNLIKRHRPRFNVLLRDDKTYPYLRLTVEDAFPRILVERRPAHPESLYYGPYPNLRLRDTLRLIRRHFGICDCKSPQDGGARRACLRHALGQCPGPCVGAVRREDYARNVARVRMFLEGKHDPLSAQVRAEMQRAADARAYEEAARLRDLLASLAGMGKRSTVVTSEPVDVDAVALAAGMGKAVAVVLPMRQGRVVGFARLTLDNEMEEPLAEVLPRFLEQYYAPGVFVPAEVLIPRKMSPPPGWTEWVRERRGGPFRVRVPSRGWRKRLMGLAVENALDTVREEAGRRRILEDLGRSLGMPRVPRTIACFDVSALQGSLTVGSAVLFRDGLPDKSGYRKFRMRTVQGPDDLAAHREMMGRFLGLLHREGIPPPDLFLIDGGPGQLEAVRPVLSGLLGAGHALAALAKREEQVFAAGRSGPVAVRGPVRLLLMRARDEAHRFAHGYHRILREKTSFRSVLQDIRGLGEVRVAALLRRFGSVEGIRKASREDIAGVRGITEGLADRIRERLQEGGE